MKGKHGAAAAVRKEVQARDAEIERYRNAVVRLTKERNEARAALTDAQKRHAAIERELRARLEHLASPQVEALNRELSVAHDERDAVQAAYKNLRNVFNSQFLHDLVSLFENAGVPAGIATRAVADLQTYLTDRGDPVAMVRRRKEATQNYGGVGQWGVRAPKSGGGPDG
jgi:hypothetical protein